MTAATKTARRKQVQVIRNSLAAYGSDPDGPVALASLQAALSLLRRLIDMQTAAQRDRVGPP